MTQAMMLRNGNSDMSYWCVVCVPKLSPPFWSATLGSAEPTAFGRCLFDLLDDNLIFTKFCQNTAEAVQAGFDSRQVVFETLAGLRVGVADFGLQFSV